MDNRRYKLRGFPGCNTADWSVVDTETGRTVMEGETYTVCDQLACSLNGYDGGCGEIEELADNIRKAVAQ